MGSVGGIIAALGGLGGCTLPVLFGVAQDLLGISSGAFMVLYAVLAVCMTVMFFAMRVRNVIAKSSRQHKRTIFIKRLNNAQISCRKGIVVHANH